MRYSLAAALVALSFSVQATAQGAKKNNKKEPAGPSLAEGADPVDEETSDDGRFTPKGKTGKLKEKTKKKTKPEQIEEIPRKKINVFADILAVWGTPPEPDAQPIYDKDENVTGFGFVIGGTYDLKPELSLGLRIPFTRADFQTTTRMYGIPFDGTANALGNPEVIAQYRKKLSPGVFVPIDVGLGIPFAQGDPDPTSIDHPAAAKAMANRSMDAGTGWHDSELYYVGRVPVKASIGYLRQRVTWNFHASTKLVAAPKIRGALEVEGDLDTMVAEVEEYKYNPVALRNITEVGAAWNPWAGIWIGLDAWLGINIIDELERVSQATPPSAFQWVLEPGLGYDFEFLKVNLSYIKPLGGRLEDIQGARLTAEMGF